MNRSTGQLASARLDLREADHFYPGSRRRTRTTAKREARRASRRLSKALAREEV